MPDVKLLRIHEHERQERPVGDVITVNKFQATWLVQNQIGELVYPKKSKSVSDADETGDNQQ